MIGSEPDTFRPVFYPGVSPYQHQYQEFKKKAFSNQKGINPIVRMTPFKIRSGSMITRKVWLLT